MLAKGGNVMQDSWLVLGFLFMSGGQEGSGCDGGEGYTHQHQASSCLPSSGGRLEGFHK